MINEVDSGRRDKVGSKLQTSPGFEINPLPVNEANNSQSSTQQRVYKKEDDYFNNDIINDDFDPE